MAIEIPSSSFVILSQPRSGTHFLRGLLDSHPDVTCYSEVFSHGGVEDFFPQFADCENAAEIFPQILETAETSASGLVVQDHQCKGASPRNWGHEILLKCEPAPLLIWLNRENELAQYASWLVALQTGVWLRHSSEVAQNMIPRGFLRPNPQDAAAWICQKKESRVRLRRMLGDLPSLETSYEALVERPDVFCNQVFSALNLKAHQVEPKTFPQRAYRVQEVFGNFEEIVEAVTERMDSCDFFKYEFTTDWFSGRIPKWTEHLGHLKGSRVDALEIGSWEGRSAVWLLENILDKPESALTCIDLFANANAENRFDRNILATGDAQKVTKLKGESWTHLRMLEPESFDFIYIDGSHHGRNVMEDAVLCFRLLRKGGIMIFDDYPWRGSRAYDSFPKEAIDGFLGCYRGCLEVLDKGWQVFVRRKDRNPTETERQFRRPKELAKVT